MAGPSDLLGNDNPLSWDKESRNRVCVGVIIGLLKSPSVLERTSLMLFSSEWVCL